MNYLPKVLLALFIFSGTTMYAIKRPVLSLEDKKIILERQKDLGHFFKAKDALTKQALFSTEHPTEKERYTLQNEVWLANYLATEFLTILHSLANNTTDSYTALKCAIELNRVPDVKLLIQLGVNPYDTSEKGMSPLMLAVRQVSLESVKAILSHNILTRDALTHRAYIKRLLLQEAKDENGLPFEAHYIAEQLLEEHDEYGNPVHDEKTVRHIMSLVDLDNVAATHTTLLQEYRLTPYQKQRAIRTMVRTKPKYGFVAGGFARVFDRPTVRKKPTQITVLQERKIKKPRKKR